MSDGPAHFRNETLRHLTKGLNAKHHFITARCPWSNGGIERCGRELLRTARAVISGPELRTDSRFDINLILQSAINQYSSHQRKTISLLAAFGGLNPKQPASTFIRGNTALVLTVSEVQLERVAHIDHLVTAMDNIHPMVKTALADNQERYGTFMSNGLIPNFEEDNFDLVVKNDFH